MSGEESKVIPGGIFVEIDWFEKDIETSKSIAEDIKAFLGKLRQRLLQADEDLGEEREKQREELRPEVEKEAESELRQRFADALRDLIERTPDTNLRQALICWCSNLPLMTHRPIEEVTAR